MLLRQLFVKRKILLLLRYWFKEMQSPTRLNSFYVNKKKEGRYKRKRKMGNNIPKLFVRVCYSIDDGRVGPLR